MNFPWKKKKSWAKESPAQWAWCWGVGGREEGQSLLVLSPHPSSLMILPIFLWGCDPNQGMEQSMEPVGWTKLAVSVVVFWNDFHLILIYMYENKYTMRKFSFSHVTHNMAFAIIKEWEKGEASMRGGKSFLSLCYSLSHKERIRLWHLMIWFDDENLI